MKTNLYKKIEKFVIGAWKKSNNQNDIKHAKRTVYWLKKLKPNADETLLIAGLTHDIERAFYGDWKKGSDNPEKLRKHQNLSAKEVEKFLIQEKADKLIIQRIVLLIKHHEEGGDEEQNILCDADCLAFLEGKSIRLAKKYKKINEVQEGERRLKMVYNRINSSHAKKIAKKWYQKAINELK